MPSSYHGNVLAIKQALTARGIDANELLEESGINLPDYKNGLHRVPDELILNFIDLVVRKTDPSISLEAVKCLSPASYHALGTGLLYSDTLRSFCQRYQRYFSLISTLFNVEYHETIGTAYLAGESITGDLPNVNNFDSDSFVAMTMKFVRMICGPHYKPKKVCLSWTPPSELIGKYREELDCEIEFSSDKTAVYFEVIDLDKELPSSNRELARQSDKTITEFLEKTGSVDLKSRVYSKLIEFLPSGDCSRERVAMSLNMTPSTFHNKLKVEGSNYQDLLDNIRKELAEQYIGKNGISIGEAAYLLGFTDCSNFSRAFKRWVGMSPREYKSSVKHD